MKNKLTTPIAILIGSFMIAGTILYTNGNISNPIIRTAHAEINGRDLNTIESNLIEINSTLYDINGHNLMMKSYLKEISRDTRGICISHNPLHFPTTCSKYR